MPHEVDLIIIVVVITTAMIVITGDYFLSATELDG